MSLVAGDVGHAFPTGDLFRRLTVSAEVEGDDHAVIARAERHLARHFGEARLGLAGARTQVRDDRLGVGGIERAVDLALGPEAEGSPIAWRVAYERVEHPSRATANRRSSRDRSWWRRDRAALKGARGAKQ